MARLQLVMFVLFTWLVSGAALAQPAEFDFEAGVELNYGSPEIDREWAKQSNTGNTANPANRRAREQWVAAVRKSCPECKIEKFKDKYKVNAYRVRYPDGHFFDITLDPGVVEIVIDRAMTEYLAKHVDRIQRDIFDNAAKIGLTPARDASSMHVNISVETAFGGDLTKFANFMIDFLNNKQVYTKVLGQHDIYNAPFIDDLKPAQKKAFETVLVDLRAGKIATIPEFAERIYKEVYYETTWSSNKQFVADKELAQKYQAFNLVSLVMDIAAKHRAELRTFDMPENAQQLVRTLELIRARIGVTNSWSTIQDYNVQSSGGVIQSFRHFVESSRRSWRKFQATVPMRLWNALRRYNEGRGLPTADCVVLGGAAP